MGDGRPPTFNRNPYNGYINPYYWVDFSHPLLYGNNGSLDPGTCFKDPFVFFFFGCSLDRFFFIFYYLYYVHETFSLVGNACNFHFVFLLWCQKIDGDFMLFYMAQKKQKKTKKYIRTYAIILFSLKKRVIFFEDLYTCYARSNPSIRGSTAASSFISITSYLCKNGSLTFCVERSMKTVLWTILAYLNDFLQRFLEPVISSHGNLRYPPQSYSPQ